MHFLYRFLTSFFLIFAPLYLKYRLIKKKEDKSRFREKLSFIKIPRGDGFLVWFHAASVGETLSILPIIHALEKNTKINKILITTITITAANILEKKLNQSKKIIHQFLPFDTNKYTEKFLNHWSPNLSIFVESEIWPNLIFKIKNKKIPLLLINARITKKTFAKWKFFKKFSKKIFESFDLCLAQNKETENYLKILGSKSIKNYGNLKFSNVKSLNGGYLNDNLKHLVEKRKIWCASSTHDSEEKICANVHIKLKKIYNNLLTVIIPRHASRADSIAKELSNLNLKIKLHNNNQKIEDDVDICLVDTYGETNKFFNISKSVFIGGSLVNHGGQNPIEPSRHNCQIYHGPFIQNFQEIYGYLNNLLISKKINNTNDLYNYLLEDLKSKKSQDQEIAKKIDFYGQEILDNVLSDIKDYIAR